MIASVDIFDTSLTRVVGRPDSVFILLGHRLWKQGLIPIGPEAFARGRVSAEALSRQNVPNGEPTLAEIYSALTWLLALPQGAAESMMQQELALEAEVLRAVPGAAESLQQLKATAEATVFLSDMYLPSAFLKEQLARLLSLPEPIEVIVSCESRSSKASGALFRDLMNGKDVRPSDLLHVGNSALADGAVPKRLGIRTQPFRDADLNRYETILEDHRWETEGLTSLLAGASRMARLTIPAENLRERVVRDVAAGVAAPVLVSYVLWILRKAQDLSLKRLYFVSRDGELLLEIASALTEKLGLDIELRYLYGSRQAWHLPAIGLTTRPEEDWQFADIPCGLSVEVLLETVGLKPRDVEPALLRHGFMPRSWRDPIGPRGREALQRFISDPEVRTFIKCRADATRQQMLRYLRQEGMTDKIPTGVVDLGWSGRMFDSLWAVLRLEQSEPPHGFLFGLGGSRALTGDMPKEAYLTDLRSQQGYRNHFPAAVSLLETFCEGTHGMVISYVLQNGVVAPVLKEATNTQAVTLGIPKLRQTIGAFLNSLLISKEGIGLGADLRPAAADLLSALWNEPTRLEAAVWGSHLHFAIQTESYGFPLAKPFQVGDVLRRLFRGSVHRPEIPWEMASLRLTPSIVRTALSAAARSRTTARRLAWWRRSAGSAQRPRLQA